MAIDTIKTSAILDGAVGTADINDAAVTTAKIADANITTLKILDGNVTSAKLDTNITVSGDLTVDTNTLFVDSTNNRVGIGTSSPSAKLDVNSGDIAISSTQASDDGDLGEFQFWNTTNAGSGSGTSFVNDVAAIQGQMQGTGNNSGGSLHFYTKADGGSKTEQMAITGDGNVGIGTVSPNSKLTSQTASTSTSVFSFAGQLNNSYGSNDSITALGFHNRADVNATGVGAAIALSGGGTSAGSGNLIFCIKPTSDIASVVAPSHEKVRIDSSGNLLVGTTNNTPVQSNVAGGFSYRPGAQLEVNGGATQSAFFGRTNDGVVVNFYSAGSSEGYISISGTTTSYVGGHLARLSQLSNNIRDDALLKGTVMSNLDQMASWLVDAVEATYYTEDDELPDGVSVGDEKTTAVAEYYQDNEQLNCTKISDVEGDANVAGVFVHWDNDDDFYTNDMTLAMTGDMIIRIAQGTTVSRGDLLMSAGDGTAKPQEDDIVRAKTIAKVTSTNVTCTYDDGSYCVPCVLMAC